MSLDDFIPQVREIEVAGKAIKVSPLKIRQIPGFARAVGPASERLFGGDILGAIGAHGEDLILAIAIALDESTEWIGDLSPPDFLRLVSEVVEVNGDFFARRVRPALEETVERISKSMTREAGG